MVEVDPLSMLANELSRLIAFYHNRQQLFESTNGTVVGFDIRDVIRSHLYSRFENDGLTPIPNFRFEEWTYDIIGMKEFQIVLAVVIRGDNHEDFRQLCLLPNKVNKILLALTTKAIPENVPDGITIVKIPHKPTEPIRINLNIRGVMCEYNKAFKEAYRIEPIYSNTRLLEPSTKMSSWWAVNGSPYKFFDYCVWAMAYRKGTKNIEFVRLDELIDKELLAKFKSERERKSYDGQWTTKGWGGLT
jgi:hypothetical protein